MEKINLYGYTIYDNGNILTLNGDLMKFNKTITLSINGELKKVSYARFVYYAFHQNFDFDNHKLIIKHKDNNIENNDINNLYMEHCGEHLKGEKNSRAKLTNKEVMEIKELYKKGQENDKDCELNNPFKKYSYRKLAEMYGVSHNLIKQIIKGECRNNG